MSDIDERYDDTDHIEGDADALDCKPHVLSRGDGPRRDSALSGMVIDGGSGAGVCATDKCGSASMVQTKAAGSPIDRFMMLSPTPASRLGGWPPLPDQFDLARSPGLVEERLLRAVEAQNREPALAGQRLNPVAILGIGGFGWAEINGRGAVRVRHGSR
jgi:hypothetical protein